MKKLTYIVFSFLLILALVSCINFGDKKNYRTSTTEMQTEPSPSTVELPATPEPMESPFIPDEENVSMPDPD